MMAGQVSTVVDGTGIQIGSDTDKQFYPSRLSPPRHIHMNVNRLATVIDKALLAGSMRLRYACVLAALPTAQQLARAQIPYAGPSPHDAKYSSHSK